MAIAAGRTHTAGAEHRYHISPARRWLFRFIGTVLFGIGALLLYPFLFVFESFMLMSGIFIVACTIALLSFIEGWIFWYNAQRMQLVTTSDGFTIHACGYTLSSPWSNVSRIGTRWGEEFLYLDSPAHVEGPLAWLARLYRFNRFIRLGTWGQWWGSTPLARDLEAAIPSIVGAARSR